ncbi:DUF1493 family protein [Pantoea sp. CTOTU49201]|uniref:DUF1493 family protein n=1 Tax=Pantoea sp. CTOTU49201 TaxID=2953855 RepID=UPI00289F6E20|nr:DUF1493 family protein [Pantoea sp. CTOTU49201]
MVDENQVLDFFREELSLMTTWRLKPIPIEFETPLQGYAGWDELPYAIEDFGKKYNVDTTVINFDAYYPWRTETVFRKYFSKEPIQQTVKPLTVRMFAESAKAGRWLYD